MLHRALHLQLVLTQHFNAMACGQQLSRWGVRAWLHQPLTLAMAPSLLTQAPWWVAAHLCTGLACPHLIHA